MYLSADPKVRNPGWRTLQRVLRGESVDGEKPRPLSRSAWACIHFAWVQVFASLIVWYVYGIGPTIESPAADEISVFNNAKIMLLPAMLLELCYMLSARSRDSRLQRTSYEISYFLIFEFMAKMACYTFMAQFSGGIVHENLRASGPVRGCYSVRYFEWSIAVPVLLVINNYPLCGTTSLRACLCRLFPNLLVTWAYILTSWIALVTPHAGAGWSLMSLAFVAYLVSVADQVSIVQESDQEIEGRNFKVGIVVVKEAIFFAYGFVYLIGLANMISSLFEQTFYTYGDVVLKVAHASVIVVVRNWDDLAQLQQALEEQLETGKQDLSRLFRRASAPIFAINTDGCIVAWNNHLAKVSGITEAEAFGKPVVDFVHEESRDTLCHAIESCRSGLSSGAMDIVLKQVSKGPQGEDEAPAQLLLTLVVQQGCETNDLILGVGQDLTEVAHLKALQERKARFTAVLGHELRSPLHGIIGLSGTMADVTPDKNQKRQLAMIKGCAARLLDLVTNIMEMAKAEKMEVSGTQAVAKSDVNIMDVVEEVVGMTQMAIDKSGKHLIGKDVRLLNNMREGKLPIIKGDQYKITQLLYNLITNAAKFTAKGTISIVAREVEGHMLEIDVADTGHGISAEGLKKIFEPFQQEEGKPSHGFQGIGLGLSVAMSVAKMHGGNIRVASSLGKGSTFTFCLPCDSNHRVVRTLRSEDECDGTRNTDRGISATGITRNSGSDSKRTVNIHSKVPRGGVTTIGSQLPLLLSVDDDEINQEVIERTFGREYRVIRAMDGMEALEYLDSGKEFPSIMLLDVMMPGLTGFEVVKEVRTKRGLMHMQLPVVMLSARSPQDATAIEALESGATDYMQKPFCSSMLKLRLQLIDEVRKELRSAEAIVCSSEKDSNSRTQDAIAAQVAQPVVLPHTDATANASPSKLEEVTMYLETIEQLKEERDQLRTRLKSGLAEASIADRQSKSAFDERDRLKEEHSLRNDFDKLAPVASKTFPVSESTASLYSISASSPSVEASIAESHADFYRAEKDACQHELSSLREKVGRLKSEAWLNRHRADCLDRELRFVRSFMSAHL